VNGSYPYGKPGMLDHLLEQVFWLACLVVFVVPWWVGFYVLGQAVGTW